MRLCMFHPVDRPMERGWVGRIDGDRVIQLAAQTLQSFFTGGGLAREHAEYPLAEVRLLAPVLHPPAVRLFEDPETFGFANPAAIVGPGVQVGGACNSLLQARLALVPRVAAVVGAEGAIAGLTILAEWRAPALRAPKDRDFALGLGPVIVTRDELGADGLEGAVSVEGSEAVTLVDSFDWDAARALAARGTRLLPGDVLGGPPLAVVDVPPGSAVEVAVPCLGMLDATAA